MNIFILFFSLVVSVYVSVLMLKRNHKKWRALLIALGVNTVLLTAITWILFIYNDEARLFGIGQTNLLELIFSIPIITWVNFLILELVKQKRIGITK